MNIPAHARAASLIPSLAIVTQTWMQTGTERFLRLKLVDGRPLGHQPGQFVQVSVFGAGEVPISVCSSPSRAPSFDLSIRAAGDVTNQIHRVEEGDFLGIRGPYGQGFPLGEIRGHDVLMVAGGIGIVPLRSLIQYILDNRGQFERLIIIYGSRNPSTLLFGDEIAEWKRDPKADIHVTVDEPDSEWKGDVGTLLVPLRHVELEPDNSLVVAAVGPAVMYRYVAAELFRKGLSEQQIYFSLERRFKCGIGKCGHCQLNDYYVCLDGPVFRYDRLIGRPEAVEVWAPQKATDRISRI